MLSIYDEVRITNLSAREQNNQCPGSDLPGRKLIYRRFTPDVLAREWNIRNVSIVHLLNSLP